MILDVDETLIHATHRALNHEPAFRVGDYYVYTRPHLSGFIDSVANQFELAIWSSSTAAYLHPVVQQVLPKTDLKFVWSRTQCTQRYDMEWHEYYFVKKLEKVKRLGYSLEQVLIVDDTPRKCELNYGNAVYIQPFLGELDDDWLVKLGNYLPTLATVDNVRSIEKRGWSVRF